MPTVTYNQAVDSVWGTAHVATVKHWQDKFMRDLYGRSKWVPFMGKGPDDGDSIIYVDNMLTKVAGDRIRFMLVPSLSGSPKVGEDTQYLDNEEVMDIYSDDVLIEDIGNAVRTRGRMSETRIPGGGGGSNNRLRALFKSALAEWFNEYVFDDYISRCLCGDTTLTFGQTVSAPSTYRVIYGGDATATNDIDATDKFDLGLIDKCVVMAKERAAAGVPRIRPARLGGLDGADYGYLVVIHPRHTRDIRTNTSTGQWLDITKFAKERGKDNPIFAGVLKNNLVGWYNGCAIVENESLFTSTTWGNPATVVGATALFLGAQALGFCWCSKPRVAEEILDYKRKRGAAIEAIFGLDKLKYNGTDHSTIAIHTAAASSY